MRKELLRVFYMALLGCRPVVARLLLDGHFVNLLLSQCLGEIVDLALQ